MTDYSKITALYSRLSVGDEVVTGGGTYRILGVNADGTSEREMLRFPRFIIPVLCSRLPAP